MDSTPAKRRKTSPTTAAPVENRPTTPSRIPVLRTEPAQTVPARPSFASPTRASLSRHNPHLLARPTSSGAGTDKNAGRGRNLQDVFDRALGRDEPPAQADGRDSQGIRPTTPNVADNSTETQPLRSTRSVVPKSTRSVGGSLASQPRRMSRSPIKQFRGNAELPDATPAEVNLQRVGDPFKRGGLRRSPVVDSPAAKEPTPTDTTQEANPFARRGLRRSNPTTQENDQAQREEPTPPEPVFPRSSPPIIAQATEALEAASEGHGTPTPHSGHIPDLAIAAIEPIVSNTPEEEPIVSSFQERLAQAMDSPLPSQLPDNEEPELPPTPTQRGIDDPIVTTPPTGIHNLSGKRPKRSKNLAKTLKSSPLKPKNAPVQASMEESTKGPQKNQQERPRTNPKETRQKSPPTKSQAPPQKSQKSALNAQGKVRQKPQATTEEAPPLRRRSARFAIPEDPYASQRKDIEELKKELQQLELDVTLASEENRRLHAHYEESTAPPLSPPNLEEILAMLIRFTASEQPPAPKPKSTSIFDSIGSFLPFSGRRKAAPTPLPISTATIVTHKPIKANDPLPRLQFFTPLIYTSNAAAVPPTEEESEATRSIKQKHFISISHPLGLFAARVLMTVDTSLLSITDLTIEKLEPTAEAELGGFVRERTSGQSVLGRDLSVVCWAMSRWVDVAILRARFWCALSSEFGTPEARARSRQRAMRKRKRKRRPASSPESGILAIEGPASNEAAPARDDDAAAPDTDDDDEEEEEHAHKQQTWTRAQIMPHMGRTALVIANGEVELVVEWRVGFDWTGEAESLITASASVPETWRHQDTRNSLHKIPDTFTRLLGQNGPLGAVRTLVGLLMPAS